VSVRGGEPAWFRDNRDHVYSSVGSEDRSSQRASQRLQAVAKKKGAAKTMVVPSSFLKKPNMEGPCISSDEF